MLIILDGYNVIHAVPDLEIKLREGLRPARDYLLHMCLTLQHQRRDIEKIVIVFDGSSEVVDLASTRERSVQVIYTESGEDADDRIMDLLNLWSKKKSITVVSNDNYVYNHARALGAKVISAAEFYGLLSPAKKKFPRQLVGARESKISDHLARSITDEYKRHLGL